MDKELDMQWSQIALLERDLFNYFSVMFSLRGRADVDYQIRQLSGLIHYTLDKMKNEAPKLTADNKWDMFLEDLTGDTEETEHGNG